MKQHQQPRLSPTTVATSPSPVSSPLPQTTTATTTAAAGGAPRGPGVKRSAAAAGGGGKGEPKLKKGEIEKGIPNKYLVFLEQDYEANKSNKVVLTPENINIVPTFAFVVVACCYVFDRSLHHVLFLFVRP